MIIIVIVIVVFVAYAIIVGFAEEGKQNIRDRVAEDVLKNFNYQKEKDSILSISRQSVPKSHRCPRCEGILVLRIGKYGNFFGCSNYPRCKFTKNI